MLPLTNAEQNQDGCPPISTNCVIWQGNDIPCINLCKGDSISDVVSKLAQELCDLVTQFDITTFDLTCFNPICPSPENTHDLIQFLVQQVCTLNGITPPTPGGSAGCPDCIVTIAPCFFFTSPIGDQVTTMQLTDYITAIGNKICTQVQQIATLQASVTNLDQRVTALEEQPIVPPVEPSLPSDCVISPSPIGGVLVSTLVAALETQFCELRTATGLPNALFAAIAKECSGLDLAPSLALTNVNMGSLPGWITQANYSNLSDSINNMWITICDLRAAVSNIQTNCCPSGCDGIDLTMTATFDGVSTINVFFTGTVPIGFTDGTGNQITITDCMGNIFVTPIQIISNVNGSGVPISISGTALTTGCNFTLHANRNSVNTTTNTTCQGVLDYTLVNTTACPTVIATPTDSNISFSFNNTVPTAITYTVNLYQSDGVTLVTSQTFANPVVGPVGGIFNGLTDLTTYRLQVVITAGTNPSTPCPSITVSTLEGFFWLSNSNTGDFFLNDNLGLPDRYLLT